ncbi:MAG: leucine-rich repeat domain-containing protein [Paludibacteraceae bacterium]|nr:leucine-rich repeat domain-containing protein [Paludibacteraceae bacterium]
MKKLLTLLLCLIVGIGSISAERGQYRQSGTFSNGGTWEIVSGILTIDADVIPDAPSTRPMAREDLVGNACNVWENMSPWWGASKYITEVRLSSRVYKIGKYAFAGLTNLRKVVIDNNNRTYNIEIGEEAFSECWRLESFDFSRVQIIHPRAFRSCYYLGKKIELPVLQTVGEDAFLYCIN